MSVMPFFSADGSWIGFYSLGVGIMRQPIEGGPPVKIVDDPGPNTFRGATATRDGMLIYATTQGLYRVSSGGGGKPELLAASPANQVFFGPVLLPSERAVLLTLFTLGEKPARDVVVFDLDTREQKLLLEDDRGATYVSTGHLVFGRNTTLMAVPFDFEGLAVTGEPVALFEGVRTGGAASDFGLSASGTLVYVPATAPTANLSRIVWVSRDGEVVEYPQIDSLDRPHDPRLSPDGRGLLLTTGDKRIAVYDIEGRPSIPIATEPISGLGVWSPDGTQVAFASNQHGIIQLYVAPADGSLRNPAPLRSDGLSAGPHAWSRDGELIVVRVRNNKGEVVAVRPDADSPVREVVVTEDPALDPALSPDGRWLAYVTTRTGFADVWVKRYPDGTPYRVSQGGGLEPVWSRDGRELYFLRDDSLMAVAVETSGDDFSFDRAVELFRSPYVTSPSEGELSYDVDPEGRFLMIEQPGGAGAAEAPASIVVVQNWLEELERRVPRN
jgi:serine/threonine-protein kinase